MEEQPQPTENPPSYAEVARNLPYNPPCGEDGGRQMDPKQPQYTWADPNVHAYPPVEQSQYPPPPPPAGPGPYGPAYGQPMLAYYGQAAYGTPYCPSQQPQQQVMVIGGQHHQPVLIEHVQSFAGHIVLSCVVTFCCNFIVGFVAFVLASKRPLTCKTVKKIKIHYHRYHSVTLLIGDSGTRCCILKCFNKSGHR